LAHILVEAINAGIASLTKARRKFEKKLEMWANAQRDGRPVEHRWCPLVNAVKFG